MPAARTACTRRVRRTCYPWPPDGRPGLRRAHRRRTRPPRRAGRARRTRRAGGRAGGRRNQEVRSAGRARSPPTRSGLAQFGTGVRRRADRRPSGHRPSGEQRRSRPARRAPDDRGRVRTPLRHQRTGALRPHRAPARRTGPGGARQGRAPQLALPQEGRPRLPRPDVGEGLRREPYVRPLETRHDRLRTGAGPAASGLACTHHQRARPSRAHQHEPHPASLGEPRLHGRRRRQALPAAHAIRRTRSPPPALRGDRPRRQRGPVLRPLRQGRTARTRRRGPSQRRSRRSHRRETAVDRGAGPDRVSSL